MKEQKVKRYRKANNKIIFNSKNKFGKGPLFVLYL